MSIRSCAGNINGIAGKKSDKQYAAGNDYGLSAFDQYTAFWYVQQSGQSSGGSGYCSGIGSIDAGALYTGYYSTVVTRMPDNIDWRISGTESYREADVQLGRHDPGAQSGRCQYSDALREDSKMNFAVMIGGLCLGISLFFSMVSNAVLYRRLRKMKKNKEAVLRESTAVREAELVYQRMIPGEMLKMLKVKQYTDLQVGDQQYFSSIIMDVNLADLAGLIHTKKVNEVFMSINHLINPVIPVVYRHGGMVEGFQGGGFRALFPETYEQALTASISICENIKKLEGWNQQYESVSIGLHYGSVMIGVVGHEQRMTILTLSEAKEFAGTLREIGNKYKAKIVVTAKFMDFITDSPGKFNYRLLGYLRIREDNSMEKIYDVFDGDPVEIRNIKRKSKMVFEKGVELYSQQKLAESRQHFIEVLKMAPADKAAKHYLLSCDEYLNSQKVWSPCIESY